MPQKRFAKIQKAAGMSDIQQRIASIIAHHWTDDASDDLGTAEEQLWLQCECDAKYYRGADEWARHVAGVLVSELGLTSEWGLSQARGTKHVVMSERAAKEKAQRWPESFDAASRYVTAWVPDE